MRYAIADYLSDEQVERALSGVYDRVSSRDAVRRDRDGADPLGRAISDRRLRGYPDPDPSTVADVLVGGGARHRRREQSPEWRACRDAALVFIRDWDDGRLVPAGLAAAIGAWP